MKIRALRTLSGEYGLVRRGQVFEAGDNKAKQLIHRGLAAPVEVGGAKKGAAEKAPERPSKERRSGGQTGEERQRSSSQEARQPQTRGSKKREGEHESS